MSNPAADLEFRPDAIRPIRVGDAAAKRRPIAKPRRRGKAAGGNLGTEAHPLPQLRHADAPARSGASVVLTGQNGAGKTNLLEAVSLLSPGRGLRGARLDEIAMKGGGGTFAVAARIANSAGEVDLGTGVVSGPEGPEVQAPGPRQSRGRRLVGGAPRSSPRALADAGDGRPVHRPAGRPPPLSRSGGAVDRQAPRHPRQRLREGDARAEPAARRTVARRVLARRDRDRDGGARRRHRRGASRMGGAGCRA